MNRRQAKTLEIYLLAEDSLDGVMDDKSEREASRFILRVTYPAYSLAVIVCVANRKHTRHQALDSSQTSRMPLCVHCLDL